MIQFQTAPSEKEVQRAEQYLPMWKIVWNQFCEHKMALIGLVIICIFLLIAVSAPLISKVTGLDPETQNPLNRYQPMFSTVSAPVSERETDLARFQEVYPEEVNKVAQTFIEKGWVGSSDKDEALLEIISNDPAELLVKLEQIPEVGHFEKMVSGFYTFHLFGTDELGRDVLIRLIYGTRVSMGVGILVALSSALLGLIIGSIAGYYRGFLDAVLMRVTEALLSLPQVPVLIVVAAVDPTKVPILKEFVGDSNQHIIKMVFLLCIFSWMEVARLVRASTLSLREREFVLASKTIGAKDRSIILSHLFPNVVAPLLVQVTLNVGNAILYESVLSFLGMGIQPPTPSWGNMLFNAQELVTEAPALAILPGLLILIIIVSFNYLGDGLRDAIDPKAIRR